MPPPIDTTSGTPLCAHAASSVATNASIPGFCSPVSRRRPAGDSAIRGGAEPVARLDGDRARDDPAETLAVSTSRVQLRARPRAARRDQHRRREREAREIDGERALPRDHALLRATPPVLARAVGGSWPTAGQRSHTMRAGLNTGPSTHARSVVPAAAVLRGDRHGAGAAQAVAARPSAPRRRPVPGASASGRAPRRRAATAAARPRKRPRSPPGRSRPGAHRRRCRARRASRRRSRP